ncbi:D-glycero-D-manno-heptose-1,7-bisphosphate 7-phosphatase [Capsulimonas corticalis]|uniref:D,D-heptose 1,7-bisphosphate phosphatase n=1 Tax=Capsulimonas corticalis TaxID=2219043 RepID=A0A402D117_9BACT|nr:D-glycero-D-manno-heptose-1,7-bisphosphate 7-phosphatase [Capsulimonas corticalis]
MNTHTPNGYVLKSEALVMLPGVAEAVKRLNEVGVPVLVVSNQQGVGKGVMTRDDLAGIEQQMRTELDRLAGAYIDRYYYCTDLKDACSPRRKPEPGMLLEAAADFGLDLASTIFIGDSPTDIAAGYAAKVGKTALVLSGGSRFYHDGIWDPAPDFVFPDLPTAVDWIMEQRV